MSKVKRILAVVLAMAMVMAMNVTAFAAQATPGVASETDTAKVKITGITGSPTITLYKIAKGVYGAGGTGLIDYEYVTDATLAETNAGLTAEAINGIAKGLTATPATITPFVTDDTLTYSNVDDGTFESGDLHVGGYIAIITGANDGSVYNPIYLTVSYDENGALVAGEVEATGVYGTTAVAKKTNPSVNKEITGGTVADGDKKTASVGDVISYSVTPTMPSYPANATNKTVYISDTMSTGLTFNYDSLTVSITGQTVTKDGNTFKIGETVIATAAETDNGFNLSFVYDALTSDTGAVSVPVVTYTAVVNEGAVVGGNGNTNTVELYYANQPNTGDTYDDTTTKPEPDAANGLEEKEDTETVYTYQLAFKKTGVGDDADGLEGAVFGIYKTYNSETDECSDLIDQVTTNANGYAVSTNVGKGTYYVKELVAPTGYSLNETVYTITAEWTSATTTVTGTVTDRNYTTELAQGTTGTQVGWIKGGVFYEMSAFDAENLPTGVQAAYLTSANTTTTQDTATVTNGNAGSGTALLSDDIPNTKLSGLPSTGGAGIIVFTIVGCIIMIAAASMFFLSGRKKEE